MIECSECQSAQFLNITQSRVYFEDGETVTEIEETYECTLCGTTGAFEYDRHRDEAAVTGDIERTGDEPRDGSEVVA